MQTSYSQNIAAAIAGQLVDSMFKHSESYICAVAAIAFGVAVVERTDDETCQLPTAPGQKFLGISMHTHAVQPVNAGNPGYAVGRAVNILRKGKIWVNASGAVTKGQPAFFNVTTGAFGPAAAQSLTGVYAAQGGNTGNFTSSAVTAAAPAVAGVYKGEFITATEFEVFDPNGSLVGIGNTGVAFASGGLGFTITAGGTAAVAGDGFNVTVSASTATTDQAPTAVWRTSTSGAGLAQVEVNLT